MSEASDTKWMRVREVADQLCVTTTHVINSLRRHRIPGGEVVYVDGRGRSHWRVNRQVFEAHMANLREQAQPKLPDVAVVYFVQQAGNEDAPVKIGTSRTRLLRARLTHIQNGSPVRLDVVAVMLGDRQVEQALHSQFAARRLHGEWFEMHPELRALITETKRTPVSQLAWRKLTTGRPGQ